MSGCHTRHEDRTSINLPRWAKENPVVFIAVLGVLVYVALRVQYALFYSPLGVSPDDVGLNYADALARAAGVGVMIGAIAGAFWFVGPYTKFLRRVLRLDASFGARRPRILLLIGAVGWALATVILGHFEANEVKGGHEVHPSVYADTGISARHARINWISEPPSGLKTLARDRLMLLGASGAIVVFYDVSRKHAVRIPEGAIVVTVVP